ncbi:MAG TPA: hypothetical protein DIT25_00195 [Candidatus Moranbacteria bacterium]|nr:hypothetical protein [Candidatus Moranbacteria bacterium]
MINTFSLKEEQMKIKVLFFLVVVALCITTTSYAEIPNEAKKQAVVLYVITAVGTGTRDRLNLTVHELGTVVGNFTRYSIKEKCAVEKFDFDGDATNVTIRCK